MWAGYKVVSWLLSLALYRSDFAYAFRILSLYLLPSQAAAMNRCLGGYSDDQCQSKGKEL